HRKNMLQITYDLHGLCLLPGDASAIILQTNRQKSSVSLSRYGKNCYDGEQTVQIPLHDFSGFIPSQGSLAIKTSFWYPTEYAIDVKHILAYNNQAVLGETTTKN